MKKVSSLSLVKRQVSASLGKAFLNISWQGGDLERGTYLPSLSWQLNHSLFVVKLCTGTCRWCPEMPGLLCSDFSLNWKRSGVAAAGCKGCIGKTHFVLVSWRLSWEEANGWSDYSWARKGLITPPVEGVANKLRNVGVFLTADYCVALGLMLYFFEASSAIVLAVCVMLFPQSTQYNDTWSTVLFPKLFKWLT